MDEIYNQMLLENYDIEEEITIEQNNNNFEEAELLIGIAVEKEHVHNFIMESDPELEEDIAALIALDHLKQNNKYYTKLIQCGLVDEQEALDLYKEHYGELLTQEPENEMITTEPVGDVEKVYESYSSYNKDFSKFGKQFKSNIKTTETVIENVNDYSGNEFDYFGLNNIDFSEVE